MKVFPNDHRLQRLLRQVWMRQVHDLSSAETLLRNPSLRDRSVLEVALSKRFFAPFCHQEVVSGDRFEARSRWSRMALAKMPNDRIQEAARKAFEAEAESGVCNSLLTTVQRVVVRASVDLALGDSSLVPLAQAAVADIDRGIKMTGWRHLEPRRALARALRQILTDSTRWADTTYLTVAREEALALPLEDRIDHMAAVFLATGSIQVSDVVTHALIALAQHPSASAASDDAVIRETIRLFPVNASSTRIPTDDVVAAGHRYKQGNPISFVPQHYTDSPIFDPDRPIGSTWSFGVGPRSCPARKLASTLAAALLGHFRILGVAVEPDYLHNRSLATDVRARLGHGSPPPRTARTRRLLDRARYLGICLESYPATLVRALPELWRAVRGQV